MQNGKWKIEMENSGKIETANRINLLPIKQDETVIPLTADPPTSSSNYHLCLSLPCLPFPKLFYSTLTTQLNMLLLPYYTGLPRLTEPENSQDIYQISTYRF